MTDHVLKRNKILVVTPHNDDQLYNYMLNKFSSCMVPNEPIKGFKIEPVYINNVEDINSK